MRATEGSFIGRSILSIRRNQVNSIDGNHEQELEDLEFFQKHVSDRFTDLLHCQSPQPPASLVDDSPSATSGDGSAAVSSVDNILSIAWLRKLLDSFLCCEAEFKAVLVIGRDPSQFTKAPLDRLVPEFLDRAVKALDVCNAISHGVESIRHWQKLAEIAVSALQQSPFSEGQVRRARKALNVLVTSMALDEKESNSNKTTERNWSFGRRGGAAAAHKEQNAGHFRSLSWGVSRSWSASKQIQAMASNLWAPRGNEANSVAQAVYIMSVVLTLVTWVLVATVPCQERMGLASHLPVPRNVGWAQSMFGLQEKITEEWKKKEKKGTAGLLEELQKIDKLGQSLFELADSFSYPPEEQKVEEIVSLVSELDDTCRKMEDGLVPLQRQVREVFHRIVRSRTEILEIIDQAGKLSSPMN
ncbi:Protein ROH1-like [Dillenia turbinata]|uniref:Protein ROH1-like n=1 Tax=Dillenia turbinata TaxID=194707 RepID=A0AAN8ZIF2_9MAGN